MNAKKLIMAALAATLLPLLQTVQAQTGGFRFFGPLGRVITPNGDQKNDFAFFCFDNFSDSGVSGKIYTVLGSEVASMTHVRAALPGCAANGGTLPQHASWDGTAQGVRVRSGVYVYRIEAEGKSYAGTLVVVR